MAPSRFDRIGCPVGSGKHLSRTVICTSVAVLFFALLSSGDAMAQGSGITTNTTSTSTTQTITAQSLTQRTDTYRTEVTGRLNGSTVFDQTYDKAFADPTVQAGVNGARTAITTAGGPGVTIFGPSLVSSSVSIVSSTSATSNVVQSSTLSFQVAQNVGPANIAIGDRGICAAVVANGFPSGCSKPGTPFTVLNGNQNINVNANTAEQILQTTTTSQTFLTSEAYLLTGTTQAIGFVHTAVPAAAFNLADRFVRRMLDIAEDYTPYQPWSGTVGTANGAPGALSYAAGARSVASAPATKAIAAAYPPDDLARWHGFAEGYGFVTHTSGYAAIPGDRTQSYGFTGGLSYDVSYNLRLGAAFDLGHSQIDVDAIGEGARLNLPQAGLWARWHSGQFFATLAGAYGDGDTTTTIVPTGSGLASAGGYRVQIATVAGETGYRFGLGTLTATPSVGAQFSHVERGRFAETGSMLALTAPEAGYDRSKVWAGLSLGKAFDLGGRTLTVGGYGRAIAFGGSGVIVAPVVFAAGGPLMGIVGAPVGSVGADFGASLGLKFARQALAYAAYDARLRDNFTSQAFTAGIKTAW